MPSRISLRKLAEELGLHSSTVSRALNGSPAILPSTAQRVKEAAERLGYTPNPDVAVAMRAVRRANSSSLHGIFGVLNFYKETPQSPDAGAGMPIYRGILRRASKLGWVADLIPVLQGKLSPARLRTVLRAKNISGVILLPPPLRESFPQYDFKGLQVVSTSPAWAEVRALQNIATVMPDHWRNGLLLMESIRARGFRRPLFYLHRSIECRHTCATLSAFLLSQFENFWEKNIPVYGQPLERERFLSFAKKYDPDIVIGPDTFVKTFLEKDAALGVPDDISFVAYARLAEGVAGLDPKPGLIGEAAVDMITSMVIQAHDAPFRAQRTLHILGEFVEGPTLKNFGPGPPDQPQPNH